MLEEAQTVNRSIWCTRQNLEIKYFNLNLFIVLADIYIIRKENKMIVIRQQKESFKRIKLKIQYFCCLSVIDFFISEFIVLCLLETSTFRHKSILSHFCILSATKINHTLHGDISQAWNDLEVHSGDRNYDLAPVMTPYAKAVHEYFLCNKI